MTASQQNLANRGMTLLIGATLVNVLAYQIFVPVLPLYLGQLGAPSEVIGLIAGVGLLAYGLGQYPAGFLADRFDRRKVAIFSTIAYGAFFVIYVLPLSLPVAIVLRLIHAFVGGFFTPVSLALAADLAPPGKVSRGYGLWQATVMGGFLVGPLLGGILAGISLNLVFLLAAGLCLLTAVPMLLIPPVPRLGSVQGSGAIPAIDLSRGRLARLLPAMVAAAGPEYLSGAITGLWPIYLAGLGAEGWQIGLSFTLFALPAVLLSVWFGSAVDRVGGRVVMGGAIVALALLMPLYIAASAVAVLLLLIAVTGIPMAAERPVIYSEVTRVAAPSEYARAQGVLQVGLMVAQSSGAIVSGFLFGIAPWMVFASVAAVCAVSLAAVPRLRARQAVAIA